MADSDAPAHAQASNRIESLWSARGPVARALLPLSWLYRAIVAARRRLYASGWLRRQRIAAPVVVVGNWIVGGAGKTPTVIALIDVLRRAGLTPGVVSRGYGRVESQALLELTAVTSAAEAGDEPVLIRRRTGAPIVVGRARADAARLLLSLHPEVDVVVSDDGLQHFALPRVAQVVLLDERGGGNGWTLPAGPLREPLPSSLDSHTLVLYNATTPTTPLPGALIERRLSGLLPLRGWYDGASPDPQALETLKRTRSVVAAAGMARPQRFFDMLRALGLCFDELALPDHYPFATLPWPASARHVIVTEKDAVKLDPEPAGTTQVWVATLDFVFPPEFERDLLALVPRRPAS